MGGRREFSKHCAIFVKNSERMLLDRFDRLFEEMSMTEVPMQCEAGLTDPITKLEDIVFHPGIFFAPYVLFCGEKGIVFSLWWHPARITVLPIYSPYFSNLR